MKYIDLFAGVGGFRFGIEKVQPNWQCVYSSEWDKYANSVYRRHYGECDIRDIREVDATELPPFDLLCAGFPCQAFSIAGKRKGFEDTRGTLFFEIVRIAKHHQPKFMVLENVKGLISHDQGKTFEIILETLQELGYYVNWDIYNSKYYGVPQNRERVIFVCTHIKEIINIGLEQRTTFSSLVIQDFLFQLLLNNLVEVKKLQGIKSKDWVIGYLLLKEISQNLKLSEENIKDGISTLLEESKSLSTEELWQNIDLLLNKNWEENYLGKSKYTISTVINEIIEWKTYTYSQMLLAICTLTDHLRKSQKNLWNEILSNLILIKESTNYARLNNKKEENFINENGTTYLTHDEQDFPAEKPIGHLRGMPRPQVFPFREGNPKDIRNVGEDLSYTIDANYAKGTNTLEKGRRQLIQLNNPKHSNDRFYDKEGLSPTLNTMQGGNRQPKIAIPVLTPDRLEKQQNGRRFKTDGEPSFTLTAQDKHGIFDGIKIRRLTPVECERLQGFPDNWTKYDADGKEVSDTQRYKMMGNAVTTNVVSCIISSLTNKDNVG